MIFLIKCLMISYNIRRIEEFFLSLKGELRPKYQLLLKIILFLHKTKWH